MTDSPILRVTDLTVTAAGPSDTRLVDGASFDVFAGQRLGIIGESGSGKTLTALSALGLVPDALHHSGSVRLAGHELVGASDRKLRRLRGSTVAMVFQEPLTALDPLMRIGKQLRFAARAGKTTVEGLLADVSLPAETARRFPHELSGGQRQRVLIAMAMATRPDLLICDEPTTALDARTQAEVLNVIHDLTEHHDTALLFITHDLAVAEAMCDELVVMHGGRIVERGPAPAVLTAPQDPYTRELIAASRLQPARPAGDPARSRVAVTATRVSKSFGPTQAVREVSLRVARGERVGIVGGSGSGKTTLLSCIAGLVRPDAGDVAVDGRVQMVFQDPHDSLDPRMRVGDIVAEGVTAGSPRDKVAAALADVGLPPDAAARYPHEFSGGQRQRIGIARAIVGDPDVLLADEAVSALDVSVRGQIVELLDRLVKERGLTLMFISHDFPVIRRLCDRVVVLHDGAVVEEGPTDKVWEHPREAYTRALVTAARTTR